MKKKIATILLVTILLTTCMAMLGACAERKPKEVEIEIINPLTGELFEQDAVLDLPTEQTPIEVRVKDKNSDKYLLDKNLPKTTLNESLSIKVYRLWQRDYKEDLNTEGNLPIEEEGVVASNYYEIQVTFDCKPASIEDDEYKRKYEVKTASVCFYSNKEWKGADYFELAFSEWDYWGNWGPTWQDFVEGRLGDITAEEFFAIRSKIWKDVPPLQEKVDTLEELNELRSKKVYPFFNEEYEENKVNKALQRLNAFDDTYFTEKSLIVVMQAASFEWGDLAKMRLENGNLTISFALPDGVSYPAVAVVRVSVIEVSKQAIKDVEKIKVEEIH
ncbi:MAG: hypothetical protein HDT32_06970 [Clostridiales bacterium]|nr:hypothetical protein [Clostridiales bacterium]